MSDPTSETDRMEWCYGINTVFTILKTCPARVRRILMVSRPHGRLKKIHELAHKLGMAIESVSPDVLDRQVKGTHQGVCALCVVGETKDEAWLYASIEQWLGGRAERPPFLLILDGVTDPHNLGACLRTADGVGVDAVIIPKDNSVGMTAVVEKVASGAADSVPLVAVTNLSRCIEKLKQLGIWITGTCDQAEQSLYTLNLQGPMCVVLGAEGSGLRRLTREQCDQLASIPMQGVVNSLNVSVAAGVCLYEIWRQRQLK
jgi:23S rRNA (guanosine2251-2'-O)-methyltransferase